MTLAPQVQFTNGTAKDNHVAPGTGDFFNGPSDSPTTISGT